MKIKFDHEKTIKYWLDGVKDSLEVADSLFDKKHYHYSLFFGHLALEKMLKAYYVFANKNHPPYTHALNKLASDSNLQLPNEEIKFLDKVTEFNLETRYPEYIEKIKKEFTKEYATQYLIKIKDFILWLEKRIKQ